jgi:hypothetical protein
MTDARPRLSNAELVYALRELKGMTADLETRTGQEASAVLISEIMEDPTQRDQLIALLEQFDECRSDSRTTHWVNDGSPFDRSAEPLVFDNLYFDLPTGTETVDSTYDFTASTVQIFLTKYKEAMTSPGSYDTCLSPASGYMLHESATENQNRVSYDVGAWSRVLALAKEKLQSEAVRRTPFFSRLAQVFHGDEPPVWELEKCPITQDSFLVVLHHGNDHASIGFIASGQCAFVMVSINDTAMTMNESFQNTHKFATRIADFFTAAPKSGHKAIQHMLRAL